jgi:hypothetical protein
MRVVLSSAVSFLVPVDVKLFSFVALDIRNSPQDILLLQSAYERQSSL